MSTMNVHPVYIARQRQASRQLRLPRNQNRSIPEILNAVARRPDTDDNGLNPDAAWRLGIVTDGQLRNPDTGARTGQLITDLPVTEVTQLLDTQDPSIQDPAHLTLATSCHQTVDHNRSTTPTLVRRMEETARRTIWTGAPYIPAARWEFTDGSALVQYASHIMRRFTPAGWMPSGTNTWPKPRPTADASPRALTCNHGGNKFCRWFRQPALRQRTTAFTPTKRPCPSDLPGAGADTDTKFTAMKKKSTPSIPDRRVKEIIIGSTALAIAMLLCGVLLMAAGSWPAGSVIVFLSLVALSYNIHAARCYRQRRRRTPSGTEDLPG